MDYLSPLVYYLDSKENRAPPAARRARALRLTGPRPPAENIREWGISQTTLEEVFLRLIRDVNPTAKRAHLLGGPVADVS